MAEFNGRIRYKISPSELQNKVERAGIKYIHFPIVDASIPNATDELLWQKKLSPFLLNELTLGKRLFIHCRGGLGRTGIIAARLLFDANVSHNAEEIMKMVRTARTGAIENAIQEEWIRSFTGQ